jgi:hypothetical protein
MGSKYKEIDLTSQWKYSLKDRESKVDMSAFIKASETNSGIKGFLEHLPDILKAKELRELVQHCLNAHKKDKPIIVAMGGHVIKCGLAPLLIRMMKMGLINALAGNGSVAVHDFEIALNGTTSEDVDKAIEDGSFGMAKETGDGINDAIIKAKEDRLGYGEGIGKHILLHNFPHSDKSVLASAYKQDIPITIHVAVGTDIVHQHSSADGAAIGETSMRDFRIFCEQLKSLNDGGVFLNFGSAVIMPEVFLKGVTVVRNAGFKLNNFSTAVFDMNSHYRPRINVVNRPTQSSGQGFYFIGHHEIMIPLFFSALQEEISQV